MTVLITVMKRVGHARTVSVRVGTGSSTLTRTRRAQTGPGTAAGGLSTAPARTSPTRSKPRDGAGEAANRSVKREKNADVQAHLATGAAVFTKGKTVVSGTRTSGKALPSTK